MIFQDLPVFPLDQFMTGFTLYFKYNSIIYIDHISP